MVNLLPGDVNGRHQALNSLVCAIERQALEVSKI
jgi:hypothetical protein